MNTEAMREWEFWENLSDEDREANTAGIPPYDAPEVAYMILGMLQVGKSSNVLDLGCGVGRLALEVSRRGTLVVHACDISRAMLNRVPPIGRIETHLLDGRSLPDEIDRIWGAYSVAMFQHIPVGAQRSYFAQIAARLFGGCRFAFTVALGGGEKFLDHRVDYGIVDGWCRDAGMILVDFIQQDSRGWAWFVTEKP